MSVIRTYDQLVLIIKLLLDEWGIPLAHVSGPMSIYPKAFKGPIRLAIAPYRGKRRMYVASRAAVEGLLDEILPEHLCCVWIGVALYVDSVHPPLHPEEL